MKRLLHRFALWLVEKTKPERKLVWMLGCKHGYPNLGVCPRGC